MKKRILIVGPSPTRSKGGMATVIKEIIEDQELQKNFQIDVFDSYIDGNILVRYFYSAYALIKFFIFKRHYDLYHIHAASRGSTFRKGHYIELVKKWDKKVILHIHGAEYMDFYNELSEKRKKYVVNILEKADIVVALSKDWKKKFEGTFGIKNCVVLENGINLFKLQNARADSAVNQCTFAMLGRLGRRKGTYDLIEAVEQAVKIIPDIKVYLAGDGDVEKIRKLVKNKHIDRNIEIVGWLNMDEKVSLLSKVSTVVLPSYNEGLPMSLLEGMACGKAVVSTRVGAIPEVIKKENGILISPGDIQSLADALILCCTDFTMLQNMSISNIQLIEKNYSVNIMHQKLSEIYRNVLCE